MENTIFWQTTQAFFTTFIEKQYYKTYLTGVQWTLLLTLIATIVGLAIGILIAVIQVMKLPSQFSILEKVLKGIAKVYIDLLRGTPAILQVSFIWFVILANSPLPKVVVGGISFGINSSAYMAELIRAGIQGIDKGQMEAGRSLGLSYVKTMRYIIMPQAFKNMLPAFVSEFIILIKETAVVGMIGGMDITRAGNIMIANTGNALIPLTIVALTYLVLTGVLTKVMRIVEKRTQISR